MISLIVNFNSYWIIMVNINILKIYGKKIKKFEYDL